MSRNYKINNSYSAYFVSFSIINWIDVFTRRVYKDILIDSINYCIENKKLVVYSWVIMTNHVHLLISFDGNSCTDILRDLKKFTSKTIIKEIENNPQESRKEWMLWMFERAGRGNSNNTKYQFWQQHNQPIEIHSDTEKLKRTIDYIHENPVKSGFVDKAEDYPYSSATNYAGEKGLIKIERI